MTEQEKKELIEYYSKPQNILSALKDHSYPKDYQGNLIFRAKLNELVSKLPASKKAAMKTFFLRDIEAFFDCCLFIYANKDHPDHPHRPFVLWPYQREKVLPAVIEALESPTTYDLGIAKSRDVGGTFLVLGVFLNYWLRPGANDFLISSYIEDIVDTPGNMNSLFPKLRYMLYRLPVWMMPKKFDKRKHDNVMKLINPETSSTITGKASTSGLGISTRIRAVLLDEFAYWDNDKAAYESLTDATRARIIVTTPAVHRGPNCYFYKELIRNNKLTKLVRVHVKERPDRDNDWLRKQRESRSQSDYAAHIDIEFDFAQGEGHFSREYDPVIHRRKLYYIPGATLYRAWDWGARHPCVVFGQEDTYGRILLLKLILGRNVGLETFAEYVLVKTAEWFPNAEAVDLIDETAFAATDREGLASRVEVLQGLGIDPIGVPNQKERMTLIIQKRLRTLVAGKPMLMINEEEPDEPHGFVETESCYYLHKGFSGALVTDPKNSLKWKKDPNTGYDDCFDCCGYICLYLTPSLSDKIEERQEYDPYQEEPVTRHGWMGV